MNALQKAEFEILCEFVRICDELKLTYFLVCGTALGAVKYGGFIPWDDDVDVALPRKDYEIFCERAQSLLPAHLFLQNHRTENVYPRIYSKIRNSNTTYIEKTTSNIRMNHGVYVDVFPLDGYPTEAKEIKRFEWLKKIRKLQIECALNVDYGFLRNTFFALERCMGFHKRTAEIISLLEKEMVRWPTDTSAIWCNHGNWQGRLEYAPREQYGEGLMVTFEGLPVRVPAQYDEYLTQKYGNWRADLPPEKKVGHHYYDVMDLENSYKDHM